MTYSADQVSASASYRITSTFVAGLEAAGSLRNYDSNGIEDNGLSAGPFFRIEVTPNFKVSLSGGYQELTTNSGTLTAATAFQPNIVSPALGAGQNNSYYANLTLDHRASRYYTDRLSIGHELELDVFSQQSDVTYVSYTSTWKANKNLNLALTLNYKDVSSPSLGGNATPTFNLFPQPFRPVSPSPKPSPARSSISSPTSSTPRPPRVSCRTGRSYARLPLLNLPGSWHIQSSLSGFHTKSGAIQSYEDAE